MQYLFLNYLMDGVEYEIKLFDLETVIGKIDLKS